MLNKGIFPKFLFWPTVDLDGATVVLLNDFR